MTQRPIRTLRKMLTYANQFVEVFDDEVEFPNGKQGRYLRIVNMGVGPGVVVLPIHAGMVGLVFIYRYSVSAWQWGLPRGFGKHPDPKVTAQVELREELGVETMKVSILGMMTPDSGLLASRVAVALAEIADFSYCPQDKQEVAGVQWVPLQKLWDMVATNQLEDGMTLAALALAHAKNIL